MTVNACGALFSTWTPASRLLDVMGDKQAIETVNILYIKHPRPGSALSLKYYYLLKTLKINSCGMNLE
jgi:hypothetical protein